MTERFKYIGSSYLILVKENNVLLLKRANTGFMDGYYGLPAGHLDGNETAREGGSREIREEIGIDINPMDFKVVHVLHRRAEKDERIDFFMTTDKYTGEITNCEPQKCEELKWFPLDNLPKNTIPYIRLAIENYQNGIFYSEFGYAN
jgi:ADP-ribose pyrophosphatase YjhB (NUDIX family)